MFQAALKLPRLYCMDFSNFRRRSIGARTSSIGGHSEILDCYSYWINGISIGRYWTATATGSCNDCNYAGSYRPPKCQIGCDKPTQRWYHVPRSWLKPNHNLLVVFEELGGDPSKISLVKRSVSSVCADVSEYHPNLKNWHIDSYGKSENFHPPKVHLHCNPGLAISSIKFASFGTPLGTCGSYEQGTCHSSASYDI